MKDSTRGVLAVTARTVAAAAGVVTVVVAQTAVGWGRLALMLAALAVLLVVLASYNRRFR